MQSPSSTMCCAHLFRAITFLQVELTTLFISLHGVIFRGGIRKADNPGIFPRYRARMCHSCRIQTLFSADGIHRSASVREPETAREGLVDATSALAGCAAVTCMFALPILPVSFPAGFILSICLLCAVLTGLERVGLHSTLFAAPRGDLCSEW